MSKTFQYDVVIAGGGTAGVAAAVGATRAKAKTLLIERNPYLGGEATHSGVSAFCGFYTCGGNPVKAVAGVGEELLKEMESLNSESVDYIISATGNKNINFHPEYLKCAMDNVLEKEGVTCFLHTRIIGAKTKDGEIKSIQCVDDEGIFQVEARVFVDATGDANLAYLSGADTLWGDEEGNVQAATLPFRLSGVDISCDLTPEAVEQAVIKAKKAGIQHLTREKGFILKREGSNQVAVLLPSVMPTGLSSQELTKMELDTRRQVLYYVEAFRRYLKGMEQCELTMIGPSIGFRETRRIKGKSMIKAEDVLNRKKCEDGVARGGWKPEIHKDIDKMATYMDVKEGSWFDIPLGALQSDNIGNLYAAGRMISADEAAFAAVRVMGTCFATGHSAGVAAAVQAEYGEADIRKIRAELDRQGALL